MAANTRYADCRCFLIVTFAGLAFIPWIVYGAQHRSWDRLHRYENCEWISVRNDTNDHHNNSNTVGCQMDVSCSCGSFLMNCAATTNDTSAVTPTKGSRRILLNERNCLPTTEAFQTRYDKRQKFMTMLFAVLSAVSFLCFCCVSCFFLFEDGGHETRDLPASAPTVALPCSGTDVAVAMNSEPVPPAPPYAMVQLCASSSSLASPIQSSYTQPATSTRSTRSARTVHAPRRPPSVHLYTLPSSSASRPSSSYGDDSNNNACENDGGCGSSYDGGDGGGDGGSGGGGGDD